MCAMQHCRVGHTATLVSTHCVITDGRLSACYRLFHTSTAIDKEVVERERERGGGGGRKYIGKRRQTNTETGMQRYRETGRLGDWETGRLGDMETKRRRDGYNYGETESHVMTEGLRDIET